MRKMPDFESSAGATNLLPFEHQPIHPVMAEAGLRVRMLATEAWTWNLVHRIYYGMFT